MSKENYHIAAILNEYEVVINAGSNEGLSAGDKIEIFEINDDIIDASTKENLGPLVFVKDTLEIVFVDEKYAICQKFIERKISVPSVTSSFHETIEKIAQTTRKTVEMSKESVSININKEQSLNIPRVHLRKQIPIEIGDLARIPFD